MNKSTTIAVGIAVMMSGCTQRHTNFVTDTGYEAAALRQARELETRLLESDYLVSCSVVLRNFADCAVLITPYLSAFQVYCHKDVGCVARHIRPLSADTKGGQNE